MQNELLAAGVQVIIFPVTLILGLLVYRREKRNILATIDDKIQMAIDQVGEALGLIFEKPIVKASMTNLGKLGGSAMQDKAVTNKMALDILSSPKFEGLKMAAKIGLNIDIDQYIEENGAERTLQSAIALGNQAGIDVMGLLVGGLDGANLAVGSETNGINYYLGR